MDAKLKPVTRLDQLDREAFEAMVGSASFALLRKRVEADLRRAEEDCVGEADELKLRRAQGAVAALRNVLALPARITGEIKSGAKPL